MSICPRRPRNLRRASPVVLPAAFQAAHIVRENSVKTLLLAAGAAAIALSAGQTLAHGTPKQPIVYSQLGAYMKASPKQRAAKDWSAGQVAAMPSAGAAPVITAGADTGTSANTSAISPAPAPA